jgi:hypothetical protein
MYILRVCMCSVVKAVVWSETSSQEFFHADSGKGKGFADCLFTGPEREKPNLAFGTVYVQLLDDITHKLEYGIKSLKCAFKIMRFIMKKSQNRHIFVMSVY